MIIDNQGRNRMYVAIPRDGSFLRECIVCNTKQQLQQRLITNGNGSNYSIYQCMPAGLMPKPRDKYRREKVRYFIYKANNKKIVAIVNNAKLVAEKVGFTAEYVRGKFSKITKKYGVKQATFGNYLVVKADE